MHAEPLRVTLTLFLAPTWQFLGPDIAAFTPLAQSRTATAKDPPTTHSATTIPAQFRTALTQPQSTVVAQFTCPAQSRGARDFYNNGQTVGGGLLPAESISANDATSRVAPRKSDSTKPIVPTTSAPLKAAPSERPLVTATAKTTHVPSTDALFLWPTQIKFDPTTMGAPTV